MLSAYINKIRHIYTNLYLIPINISYPKVKLTFPTRMAAMNDNKASFSGVDDEFSKSIAIIFFF